MQWFSPDSKLLQGREERVSFELPSLLRVFIIAEANGKEASIPSDMEDGRFVAPIGLGWGWNCTLRCSRGCWDEQMESYLGFKLRRQDTGKDLDKTWHLNLVSILWQGSAMMQGRVWGSFSCQLLFSVTLLHHHLPWCLRNSVFGSWQSNCICTFNNYIPASSQPWTHILIGLFPVKEKKALHGRIQYQIFWSVKVTMTI